MFVFLLLLFFACKNNDADLPPKNLQINNKPESKIEAKETFSTTADLNVIGHYLIIGYFDENNNLEKIERFLDGVILD